MLVVMMIVELYKKKIKMNKNTFFRIIAIVAVTIVANVLEGCDSSNTAYISEFEAFEKGLAESISSDKDVVKLIGFSTVSIPDSDRQNFRNLVNENSERFKNTNTVFSDDFSFYRIYFPFHTAIIEYNGKTYTADEKGAVSIPNLKDVSKITIIGRKRSETVHGTSDNIIEEDRILLKQGITNGVRTGYSIDGHICVFDMGDFIGM